MKNIHVLPTDKPSRLSIKDGILILHRLQWRKGTHHIYITSDEEIKEGDWCMYLGLSMTSFKVIEIEGDKLFYGSRESFNESLCKKIILTTDQDLIKDGVQSIDDEFLEWFVKNPSCDEVEVETDIKWKSTVYDQPDIEDGYIYKLIIPKEEPKQEIERGVTITHVGKQETLEEATKKWIKGWGGLSSPKQSFIQGAKWQQEQERMYSDKEVKHLMTLAFEQGFKKADVVEAGLEAKETDTEVNWIFLKHKK